MSDKPSDGERFYDALRAESIGGMERIWSVRGKAFKKSIERAALVFSKPYHNRIAELEMEIAQLRSLSISKKTNGGIICDTTNGPCACGAWHWDGK